MKVPKLKINENDSFSNIEKHLDPLPANKIAHPNWIKGTDLPEVTFKIAHNCENIFLLFSVKENEIRAMIKGNNNEVWHDSCVEFFITFTDSGHYYNLEQSCIGQALLGYRKEKNNSEHASDKILNNIRRNPSLGVDNFPLQKGEFEWTLLSIIPISSFWKSSLTTLEGVKAQANFYKCGDKLSSPHYLSWSPVETEEPNFHNVDFFKELLFE